MITKIHDKYYDLSKFNHPGGIEALSTCFDRDGTILFESHHPLVNKTKLNYYLKKYEINDGTKRAFNKTTTFIFDSKFAIELKTEVANYFKSIKGKKSLIESTKENKFRQIQTFFFLIGIFFCYYITLFSKNIWLCMFIEPIISWISGVNIFHDASHYSISIYPIINNILSHLVGCLFSQPYDWKHQHIIGHHMETNVINKDPDLYHGNIISPVTISFFIWFTAVIILITEHAVILWIKNKYNDIVNRQKISNIELFLYIFSKFIYLYIYIIRPFQKFPLITAISNVIVSRSLFSFLFMLNTQIGHLHDINFSKENNECWYRHQITVTSNFATNSYFHYIFSGGLNFQIEHHLFPNINHCHLPNLKHIVKRLCVKHDIEYNEFDGYFDAVKSHFNSLKILNKKINTVNLK